MDIQHVIDNALSRLHFSDDCWLWEGAVNTCGIPVLGIRDGKRTRTLCVHRLLYQRFQGAIDPRYRLSNTCGNRRCVNPAHYLVPTAAEDTGGKVVYSKATGQKRSVTLAATLSANRAPETLCRARRRAKRPSQLVL